MSTKFSELSLVNGGFAKSGPYSKQEKIFQNVM